MHIRILVALAAFCLLLFQRPSHACMWDSDTLANEARGLPDVMRVVTGRFERNPPLYYLMRLQRVSGELQRSPEKLEGYDDAAVACDRLGRDDEAIAWMEKKRALLVAANRFDPIIPDHWYRYNANVGTFWAHRWLRHGGDRRTIFEMGRAISYIKEALRLNPNAHFGREKYQLMLMEWIVKPPKLAADDMELPGFLDQSSDQSPLRSEDAVRGLSGLIVLGGAWESVDIFNALAGAIQHETGKGVVSFLARLRAEELVDEGRRSVLPGAPPGLALKNLVQGRGNMTHFVEEGRIPGVKAQFQLLRTEADSWQRSRTAYMMERLRQGRHPDTDASFWDQWRDWPPPDISPPFLSTHAWLGDYVLGCAIAVVGTAWLRLRTRRRFRANSASSPPWL